MAKTAKSHHVPAKAVKPKATATKEKKSSTVAAKSHKQEAKKVIAAPVAEAKKAAPVATAPVAKPGAPGAKPGLDAKKGGPNGMFSRPQMRRGRRPKAMADYKPNSDEEESREEDVDVKGLEYDTGIRVSKPRDDNPFNLDRYDDFEEELNFDF
jgi:hypothetical protein